MSDGAPTRYGATFRLVGMILGPVALISVLFAADLEPLQRNTLAITSLIAVWWVFEVLPIPITSMIPVVAFPLLGVMTPRQVAPYYMHDILFLFIGGFILAGSLEKWNLHRRIALKIILTVGCSPRRLVFGFILASSMLSMWILNTATTLMLTPIVLAVVSQLRTVGEDMKEDEVYRLRTALLLGVAYASSIGGMGTLIGTAPNGVSIGIFGELFPEASPPTFFEWMRGAIPFVFLMIPVTWLVLTLFLRGGRESSTTLEVLRKEYRDLGLMSRGEGLCLVMLGVTILGWVFRRDLVLGMVTVPGWERLLPDGHFVSDATVVCFVAVISFLIPVDKNKGGNLMDWRTAEAAVPWGMLLLFGAGFAIAGAFRETGLSQTLGQALGEKIQGQTLLPMTATIAGAMTFLTEVTSNTATTTIVVPVLAQLGPEIGVHPLSLMLPATISASCAFMLPVATPPNAIVFATGKIRVPVMVAHGLILNLLGILVLTGYLYLVGFEWFGFGDPATVPDWAK